MTDQFRSQYLFRIAGLVFLAMPGFVLAQSQTDAPAPPPGTSSGEWRRADQPPPQRPAPVAPGYSAGGPRDEFGEPVRRNPQVPDAPPMVLPPQLTLKKGSFVTVRVDQPLSSDRNHSGDTFSATLARPLVIDGVVVAERGQTVAGRVEEAQKAGRVQGVSRLAVQLTDLSLVDGQQLPLKTQFVGASGPTSQGRDAAAIATTTGMGAAIGAAADWGRGAAIGAGVGAVASTIGVLLTRGRETVIYPESVLTFRVEEPVTVSTERAPQAFRAVDRDDYDRPTELARQPAPVRRDCGPYGCAAPYFYGGPFYPYSYGPGLGFYYGPRVFYGGGYNFGRGYYRGRRR